MKDIFIAGAGGFGREVAWTLSRINRAAPAWRLLGFADDAPDKAAGTLSGVPLLGPVADAARRFPAAAVFIAVGDNARRAELAHRLDGREFPAIVDPTALAAPDATVGPGAYVGPFALVSVGARVGSFAIVNARAGVGHDVQVGDFAQICPGATLSGATRVETGVLMGSNASTVPGVTLGAHARVAAGVPVFSSLAPHATLSPFGVFRAPERKP